MIQCYGSGCFRHHISDEGFKKEKDCATLNIHYELWQYCVSAHVLIHSWQAMDAVPWTVWGQLSFNFLGASEAEEFTSKRKKRILLRCLRIEDLCICNTLPEVVLVTAQAATCEASATSSIATASGTVTPAPD